MSKVLVSLKLFVSEGEKRLMRMKAAEKHTDVTAWALDTLTHEASKKAGDPLTPEELARLDEMPAWQANGYSSEREAAEDAIRIQAHIAAERAQKPVDSVAEYEREYDRKFRGVPK